MALDQGLKGLLDAKAEEFNTKEFICKDPVQFPRRFTRKEDIEVSAFLTATITWGKRNSILKSAENMHREMGDSPYTYIMDGGYKSLGFQNIHRTFFGHDMAYLCKGLHAIYRQYGGLEALFSSVAAGEGRLWEGIGLFRKHIIEANNCGGHRSLKHISNPDSSACKRLHLALRWLVRDDGIVDLGIWKSLSPSELFIPLDTHVISTAYQLGLLRRKQNNRKAAEELTGRLRGFDPADPVKYDFALFGLGESGALPAD